MSTVCPTIRNLISLAAASTESECTFLARSSAARCFDVLVLSAGAFRAVVSIAAALFGGLVCVTSVSQVYCGRALEISYIRCDHMYRESSIDLMIAICWYSESRVTSALVLALRTALN